MLTTIAQAIKQHLSTTHQEDKLLYNGSLLAINKDNFTPITPQEQPITFIDGGQAELITTAAFSLSFIRVVAQTFDGLKRTAQKKQEFFILTLPQWENNTLYYISKIFSSQPLLFSPSLLKVKALDPLLREGKERASLVKIANMARRFAELYLAKHAQGYTLLDGTLDATYPHEEEILLTLPHTVASLAKTGTLITTSGKSPTQLLQRLSSYPIWHYHLEQQSYFVKLHPKAQHIFRFMGDKQILSSLLAHAKDPLFLGYPYGLIYVDKVARVTNAEKKTMQSRLLLNKENQELYQELMTTNAHDILDSIG